MSRFFRAAEAALALALAGAVPAMAAESGVSVSDAWLRFVIPTRPAAGYFTLTNNSDRAVSLTSFSSPGCGVAMLHRSYKENGQDKMARVAEVEVPAHGSVAFAPGSYHVMCMQPSDALRPGKTVPVTLGFGDGSSLTTDFEVRGAGG